MNTNKKTNILFILKRTLNLIDYRLVDHGERVAYIVWQMLKAENKHTEEEIVDIFFLCILHDLGAFKTEYVDSLVDDQSLFNFEFNNTIEHSLFGYLFLKNFSLLDKISDAIMFHHFRYDKLIDSDCANKDLAAKIFLADRIDVLLRKSVLVINDDLFAPMKNSVFSGSDLELFIKLDQENHITDKITSGEYHDEVSKMFEKFIMPKDKEMAYLKLLIYAIDFRSEFTVTHTINTTSISIAIAKALGLPRPEVEKIFIGALLHDIGKIATSVLILEKADKLNDFEYNIIKDHVIVSEYILKDAIDEEIFFIAVRHHEKLDGSGYPHGLSGSELSTAQRIVAIADILSALVGQRSYKDSFSKGKVCSILQDMKDTNKLCPTIVSLVLERYDEIMSKSLAAAFGTLNAYKSMNRQFKELLNAFKKNYNF